MIPKIKTGLSYNLKTGQFESGEEVVYKCSTCGVKVERRKDGTATRSCGHDQSAITADISATVVGESFIQ